MKVLELIVALQNYSSQSPENGHADVRLLFADGIAYNIERGDDSRGLMNEHYLMLIPDLASGIGVKTVRRQ